jgi:hypothetical protein
VNGFAVTRKATLLEHALNGWRLVPGATIKIVTTPGGYLGAYVLFVYPPGYRAPQAGL